MDTTASTRERAASLDRLEQASTQELALRWHDHADRLARDALIERFRPLARRLARRYATNTEPFEDLVQVASVGLVAAVNRFDPHRTIPFPAFAIPTILGELKRYFRNTGWSAHVPRADQEMALRVEQASRDLTAHVGRAPSLAQLAQYLELDTEQVITGLEAGAAHYATSLDAPMSGDDVDNREPLHASLGRAEDGYALVEMTACLAAAIPQLPHLERQALTMRLQDNLKQSDIAGRLACSQMQVSRLLRRAVTRLRESTDPVLADQAAAPPGRL